MTSINIVKVEDKHTLKAFINFPKKLYQNCAQYVPCLDLDIKYMLNPKTNPSLKFCQYQAFLAKENEEVVGRVIAIINPKANQTWSSKYVRFGYLDFIDDLKVSEALLNAVVQWGKARGMTAIQGPMGFTDYDKEGMLIGDYDKIGTITTFYNYPYYKTHMETHGYVKEADWIQIRIDIPKQLPPKFVRVAKIIKDKFKLSIKTISKREMFGQKGHDVFHLLNKAYAPLFGFTPFNEEQIDYLLKQYVPLLDCKMMPAVFNAKGELVGVAFTLPRLSKAFQRSRGALFPIGWFHILKSLKWKREDTVELILIGVRPDYQGLGVNSLFFEHLLTVCTKMGFKYAETCPQLESNTKELSQWKDLNPQYLKPRRCWRKDLS